MKVLLIIFLLTASNCIAEDNYLSKVENAQKEVVKITSNGFIPNEITLSKPDASVFFVNTTTDSLITLEIDFGNKTAHCASGNMGLKEGVLRSIKPIAPKDFAITCFPEKGNYKVTAFGITGKNTPVTSQVIVKTE